MSLQQAQAVISNLLRQPKLFNVLEFDQFSARFNLTDLERHKLQSLMRSRMVQKYASDMQMVRWISIKRALAVSLRYTNEEVFYSIFANQFDPIATHSGFDDLTIHYLDYLLSDSVPRELLMAHLPPFGVDVLKFELAQAELQYRRMKHGTPLPQGSCLRHRNFVVLSLDYDISGLIRRIDKQNGVSEESYSKLLPAQRVVRMLMLPHDGGAGYRIFEIDADTFGFLNADAVIAGNDSNTPASYESLVEVGLCAAQNFIAPLTTKNI